MNEKWKIWKNHTSDQLDTHTHTHTTPWCIEWECECESERQEEQQLSPWFTAITSSLLKISNVSAVMFLTSQPTKRGAWIFEHPIFSTWKLESISKWAKHKKFHMQHVVCCLLCKLELNYSLFTWTEQPIKAITKILLNRTGPHSGKLIFEYEIKQNRENK